MSRSRAGLAVLLRADVRRLGAVARRPTLAVWAGVVLPMALGAVGLRAAGSVASLSLDSTQDGVTLGVLLSGPLAFLAYGVLFRSADDSFLRRLGVAPEVVFAERALRLLGWGGGLALLLTILYGAAGVDAGRVISVALPATTAAWGGALAGMAWAVRAMTAHPGASAPGCLSAGMWDREVAGAAPLVYAPVLPLVAGTVSGGVVAGLGSTAAAGVVLLSFAAAILARTVCGPALPRFAPQALEMSFAPPLREDGSGLRTRHGLARLLPRRAGAAWARDAAVASRRFAWASRITWPAVVGALIGLARWSSHPATVTWVAAAAGLVLVLQGAAAIGLGRLERRGPRWVDRAVGVTPASRFLGRWAWAWGLSLWLTVPLGLGWSWWAGAGTGWVWPGVAAATSGIAALASGVAAGRR